MGVLLAIECVAVSSGSPRTLGSTVEEALQLVGVDAQRETLPGKVVTRAEAIVLLGGACDDWDQDEECENGAATCDETIHCWTISTFNDDVEDQKAEVMKSCGGNCGDVPEELSDCDT
jgi:hypothetical protein